jgi:hypothetical protein
LNQILKRQTSRFHYGSKLKNETERNYLNETDFVKTDIIPIRKGSSVFRLLTDFICLYTYEFCLSLCKIVWSSVILLLPLFVKL